MPPELMELIGVKPDPEDMAEDAWVVRQPYIKSFALLVETEVLIVVEHDAPKEHVKIDGRAAFISKVPVRGPETP